MHQRAVGGCHGGDGGELGAGTPAARAGHQRVQDAPDLAGEHGPVIRADPGNQAADRRVCAKSSELVQQPCQLGDHRLFGRPATDLPKRPTRQPAQRHVAAAEWALEIAGGQRHRHRQADLAQRRQQRHHCGQLAPGFLVPGEPVGHLAGQDHVVELAGHQPGSPAGAGKAQHRQVTG